MRKRILLGLLVLALAVFTIPPLRRPVQPHLNRFGDFLGRTLGGPLGPVLNPYRRLDSEAEIGKVVRELVRDRNMGYGRPDPDDFVAYMQREVEGEDGLDAWGSPYVLLPERDSVAVISAGPDRTYDTDDDITVKIRFAAPPTRWRR